jgi:O-antigen/teichoic acid export membrane protein
MNTRQVINNTKWIIIFKVVQSIVQLLIGMVSARYLGPSNYGLINYASSIVAFALPIMKLGFDSILVYELVTSPEKEGEIMGTSVAMSLVSGFFCILGVSLFASVMNPNDTEAIIVCVLYSIFVVFAALELFQFWFQYKLLSKYSSMVMLAAYILVSAYKIILLATGRNVYWFAVSHSVEYSAIGAALIITYFKCGGNKISFSFDCAKRMLSRSRHYILATLMVVVIQNIDHVMLTNMIGKDENGIYAAAITCASVAQFVYMAIFDSFRPLILTSKNESVHAYERNISRL